ncbi:MAG TPA: prolyl oligopeptidase family serine peptidase [Gemmatimonadaceae bacterium]|nr:prolyl oligopeptidase family serine peptidase [Gemmatimonadaceae bacterium]
MRTRFARNVPLVAAMLILSARVSAQATARPQRITYRSGSLTLVADVYKPAGPGPFPLVIWNHGRAKSPERSEFDPVGAAFIDAGYVMVAPLRRGHADAPGTWIGAAVDSVRRRFGADSAARTLTHLLETEQLDDQLAGLAAAKHLPFVDTTRIVVAGCSLGGVETLLGAEQPVGYRAGYAISTAAQNWNGNASLQARLLASVARIPIPIRMIQPPKDASVQPVIALEAEARRLGKPSFVARVAPTTMPDSEQVHCFGGPAGMHNWFPAAVAFFDSVLARPR